jgi:hypothetical protein
MPARHEVAGRRLSLGRTGVASRVLVKARARHNADVFAAAEDPVDGGRVRVAVEKREEDGLLHQFVDELDGAVEFLRGRGRQRVGQREELIADFAGEVDLARGPREDVRGQQAAPEHAQVLRFRAVGGDGRLGQLVGQGLVGLAVALRFQGELEGLETVVLREVGHERAEGVGRRGRVG